MAQIYDLKGSKRSRYVKNPEPHEVLMDENLLEGTVCLHVCVRVCAGCMCSVCVMVIFHVPV